MKRILLFLLCLSLATVYSQENTDDIDRKDSKKIASLVIDENYVPDDDLKELPVVFDMGGSIITKSRILFDTFRTIPAGGFEPVGLSR